MRRFLVILSVVAMPPGSPMALAATPHWVQATPFGGSMTALAQAPSSPQTLYAASSDSGLFVSDDGGATWRPRPGLPSFPPIAELFVDPHDPRTVYARTGTLDFLRTRNGGRSWLYIKPIPQLCFALALDREDPHILWAGTRSGLYRSPDGGDTWELAAFEGSSVLSVAIDPGDSSRFLAAIATDQGDIVVWKSVDRGATWTETSTLAIFLSDLPRFAFDPTRPDTVYAFFSSTDNSWPMFRSIDGSASWARLDEAPSIRDLVAAPDGALWAATGYGVKRSTDRGDTWLPAPTAAGAAPPSPSDGISQILLPTALPQRVFAAGYAGIWKSGDGGATWTASNQGIVTLGVASLSVAPEGPARIVAVAGTGVFRSVDQGETWTLVHTYLDGPQPIVIEAIDPRRPRTLYGIGTDGQADYVVESTNGGREWHQLPVPYTCGGDSICSVTMSAVALDPEQPDAVFVAGTYFFHFDGSGEFLLRSDDSFGTLRSLQPLHNARELVVAPGPHGAFYGVTCRGLFKSTDEGATWHEKGRGLPESLCPSGWFNRSLAIDPQTPERIYLGTTGHGVFVSTDGAETFRPMNRGLETAPIVRLLIDPMDPGQPYAGVPSRGVFRWNSDRGRWLPLNSGLPVVDFAGVLALDPQHPSHLYAGTNHHGIFRLDLAGTP